VVQQNSPMRKTNPPPGSVQPDATLCNVVQQKTRNDKTNPSDPPPSLQPRQLLAARMLTQGYSIVEVATHLGTARTTVWRWTRDRAFRAELRQLHQTLAATSSTARALARARQEVADEAVYAAARRALGFPPPLGPSANA